MKSRTPFAAAGLASVVALTLAACASGGGTTPSDSSSAPAGGGSDRGGTLTLGILQEPQSWDPAQAHVGHRLQPFQLAYDSLILREPDGTLAPMLATDWSYTDDAKTVLELNLRTDVTFSDGAPFNADAVVANIEHFKTDNGPQAGMATAIDSVTAVDADTVDITLSEPDPAMEYYLSQALGLMGSPDSLGTDAMDRLPVGTGPYTMVADKSVVGSQYVFVARDGYWNPDLQKWDEIDLKLLPDVTARVNALVTGEVDATLLDGTTFQQAEGAGKTLLEYATDWQGLLLFDRDGTLNPALKDVRVRQAINYAFDRKNLLAQLGGGKGEVTSQVFGPDSSAYVPELDTYYTYDPAKAKQLLADAGYANGLTIEMPLFTPGGETILTFVAQQLADVGITVKQTQVPIADYQGELGKGNFAAAWFSLFQGPTWVAYQQLLSDTTLYNPFKSTSPEIQAAAQALRTNGDDAEAAQALNRYVTENAWFAPWFRPSQLYYYDASKVAVVAQVQMAVPSIYNYSPVS
ncbi:ABC transporter substrate-binding protein [Isoptericola sp. b441]|uniref:ABC transporter substrate-binding protein n=1 Tax=Actinotalea lenta TaxID=3064654 RepID=A0ABT9DCI8_9CELL|nr:ABC transporter substrate-binding protein [Isoptericola sp. b441]MDO8108009.1 ABC transporter substrate-binding protein [Isoptericola sp. b441]